MFNRPPRNVESGTLCGLGSLVELGQYRVITDPSLLPTEIENYCGTDYRCTLLIGTQHESQSSDVYSAHGNIFLVKTLRYCEHNGQPHFNADVRAYWDGDGSTCWMASSRESPDHYRRATYGTVLENVKTSFSLPEEDCGNLANLGLQSHSLTGEGKWVDFQMNEWKAEGTF